jgi:dimethylargininase
LRFTRAIVRPPAATFAAGITTSGLGPPDLALALEQHEAYCHTLERLGLSLIRLAPDAAFPDSTFVEDAAIVTARGAMLTRPGAPSRAGEVAALGAALGRWFPKLEAITAPGTADGGDVCEAGPHFFIGLSARTNGEGVAQLAAWLEKHGFGSSVIDIRRMPSLLHLKTGLSWLGGRRLLATDEGRGARGARRLGGRAGAGRRGVRRHLRRDQRHRADRARMSEDRSAAGRAGLRGRRAGDVGVPEDGRGAELPVGAMVDPGSGPA